MTELSKIKLPFALALLAVMFSVTPIIQKYGSAQYLLLDIPVTVIYIYNICCILLGFSVYFYAIGLINEHQFFININKLGHSVYALALVIPLLNLILYPISLLPKLLVSIENILIFISNFLIFLVIGYAIVAVVEISLLFVTRDKINKIEQLDTQENNFLARARKLFNEEYYDLAVTESWKAFEVALNKAFEIIDIYAKPQGIFSKLELALKKELLNQNQIDALKNIRPIRNDAVHTDKLITRDDAEKALSISEKAIASLNKVEDACYFCGKIFPIYNLKYNNDNDNSVSICSACSKKYPNWQDKLSTMV
ncbi:MAG: DUF4145 domain-containing protein [Armatimonadota bacterium]